MIFLIDLLCLAEFKFTLFYFNIFYNKVFNQFNFSKIQIDTVNYLTHTIYFYIKLIQSYKVDFINIS